MDRRRRTAERAFPVLQGQADRLIQLVDRVTEGEIRCDLDGDHLGFMALCYLGEQRNHLEAICHLASKGLARSAGPIARTMIEGMALLLWAARDPSRVLQWREYAVVADWRLLQQEEAQGRRVDEDKKARIETALHDFGHEFKSRKQVSKEQAGKPPRSPYVREWYAPFKLATVFKEVEGQELYEGFYRSESDRVHWSVASLGRNVERSSRGMSYAVYASPEDSCTVLANAFQAVLQTLELVEHHLGLGFSIDIQNLKDQYNMTVRNSQEDS